MPPYTGYLIETLATLLAVCAMAFLILWGARRMGVGKASGPIELRGHLPLDGRRSIYLVKVGGLLFIVGVGEGGFTKLGEIPESDLPIRPAAPGTSFAQALARAFVRTPERREGADEGPGVRTPERREGADEPRQLSSGSE